MSELGASWGNDRPRAIRDGEGPMTRGELVLVAVVMAAVAALAVASMWSSQHAVQTHLDRLCSGGSTVGCALDGRHP